MSNISPDHTQTVEVIGTEAFENFIRELEKEGVGINTVKTPPPLPVTIAPEKSKLKYDIVIPLTEYRYSKNYKKIETLDPMKIDQLYDSDKLDEDRKTNLRLEFLTTQTVIGTVEIKPATLMGRELIALITKEVERRTGAGTFTTLYPKVQTYILKRAFGTEINDVEDPRLREALSDTPIQESIIDLLVKEINKLSTESKEIVIQQGVFKLSDTEPFVWRRKHTRCKKTIFNLVPVYNEFEVEFAKFLDNAPDIEKFSSNTTFKIDYLSSKGTIRFYYPDFIAVQKINSKSIFWIIETKGREYEDTDRKDMAIKKWCDDVSKQTKQQWRYLKVPQREFDRFKNSCKTFKCLVSKISQE
jgi:type III restriction enzyme